MHPAAKRNVTFLLVFLLFEKIINFPLNVRNTEKAILFTFKVFNLGVHTYEWSQNLRYKLLLERS